MEENKQVTDTSVGVIAYLTLIGFIIALILNNDKKDEVKSFGAFHLRQSIGLMISGLILMIGLVILTVILTLISPTLAITLSGILYPVIYLGMLALLIIGIINAANGTKKNCLLLVRSSPKLLEKHLSRFFFKYNIL